jgi:hypothetical protein
MRATLSFTILCLASTGCHMSASGDLHASWSVTQGTAASSCEAVGGDTVEIVASNAHGTRVYQEFFDCIDLDAILFDMRPGTYDVTVTLFDAGGVAMGEHTVPVKVRSDEVVEAGNFEFNFPAAEPAGEGRFAASWVVTVNGQDATCEDVGATIVEIVSEGPQGAAQQYIDRYDCTAMGATTDPLPTGTYVVSVRLLDEAGTTLNRVPVGGTLPLAVGQTVNIGDFEFQFTYRKAVFAVHMGGEDVLGGNCASTHPDGGAGVVLQEVTITQPGVSQCLLLDVTGRFGGSNEENSTPSCTAYPCQAESVVHAVQKLQNGDYFIQIRGYRGTAAQPKLCYESSNIPFKIEGQDVDLGVLSVPPTGTCN